MVRLVRRRSRPQQLWHGDTFPAGLFGARWPGGRHPKDVAAGSSSPGRPRRLLFTDADGRRRWRNRLTAPQEDVA